MISFEENRYNVGYELLIGTIACTMLFREISTLCIIFFVLFNIIFFKKIRISKQVCYLSLLIVLPFILDILFFWNNDNLFLGLKSLEKRITLLLFPLLIIGAPHKINLRKLLKVYVIFTSITLTILFTKYVYYNLDEFTKYIKGIDLWQLGYHFAKSFNSHAPALNMHICFTSLSSLYLFLKKRKYFYLLNYFFLFFCVLYINTRIAIVSCVFLSIFIVLFEFSKKKKHIKKNIKRIIIFTILLIFCTAVFTTIFPKLLEKFTVDSFSNLDKVGKIDELERPETKHGSLVMRLSIWKSALELAKNKSLYGYGASDGKRELVNYFKLTNQNHLAKWKFPVHNQYLDFLLKFGVLGFISVLLYMLNIGFLGFKLQNSLMISFFLLFFIANLTDDFLIRYDGIAFSGFWVSVFSNQFRYFTNEKN